VSSVTREAAGSDAAAIAKPLDHEGKSTLPNGPERVHPDLDSNPRGPAVRDGSVMWAAPTPNGVGPRSGGPGAPGARIVTDPPGAKRDGGAGASVATGAPAVVAQPGLLRSAAKPDVIEAGSGGDAAVAAGTAALPAQFEREGARAESGQPERSQTTGFDADARVPGAGSLTARPGAKRAGRAEASVAPDAHVALAEPETATMPIVVEVARGHQAEMANRVSSALVQAEVARQLSRARELHSARIRLGLARSIEAKRTTREQGS
jgi:hypothetical protein